MIISVYVCRECAYIIPEGILYVADGDSYACPFCQINELKKENELLKKENKFLQQLCAKKAARLIEEDS